MYYIKGKVQQPNNQDFIVIENNNIGYKIFSNEKCEKDEEISLFVNLVLSEEEITLSGFRDQMELEVFQILCSVNGIGVKTALKILKQISFKKLIYYSVNDVHSELLKISHINLENYIAVASKLKKRYKNVRFDVKDETGRKCELYKVLKSLGISDANYEKVSFIENENLTLREKLSKALRIINER